MQEPKQKMKVAIETVKSDHWNDGADVDDDDGDGGILFLLFPP